MGNTCHVLGVLAQGVFLGQSCASSSGDTAPGLVKWGEMSLNELNGGRCP